jgi:hypothetical protein
MQQEAKLIYKTFTKKLPTVFPVHYYGLPDGKIILIYARFYEKGFDNSRLEFVLANFKEFCYDYETGKVLTADAGKKRKEVSLEKLDKPDPDIKVIKSYRNIKSYSAALQKLNKRVTKKSTDKKSKEK